ncbi:probable pathogenesis-related protein ARB_02861 [Nymphaea colorata]|uniref:probable pathogenesis-related protein ARB_02861 n=1 Tax=Nymphaea colorata TaxID=210225 RepID=UPI00129D9EEB|nr:probable pathogenesis-related protein ARB_02861 [Nymphaea colorata]
MEDVNWNLVLVALWACLAAVATTADDVPPVLVDPSSSYGQQQCITKCGTCPVICAPPPPSVPSMAAPPPTNPATEPPPPPPPSGGHHHTPSSPPPPPSQSTIYPYPYYFFYSSGSSSPVAVPVGHALLFVLSLFIAFLFLV